MSNKNCGGFTRPAQVGFDKDQACGDIDEVSSCLGKEIFDLTVDIWDDPGCDGDNVVRVFNTDECVYHDGYFYWSLVDMNVDMPPTAKWSEGFTKCEMLKPYSLVDCSGKVLDSGDSVASCEDLSEAIADIPQPTKCGGGEIDGPLVQCDQMGDGLTFDEATGKYSVDTQELCIVSKTGISQCAEYEQMYLAADPVTGCKNIVEADSVDLFITTSVSDRDDLGGGTVMYPIDPYDDVGLYTQASLTADILAGTVDAAKLDLSRSGCVEFDAPCDGLYEIRVGHTVSFDPDLGGKSTTFHTINGEDPISENNIFIAAGTFTSFDGQTVFSSYRELTAGTNTICTYVVQTNSNAPAAQTPFKQAPAGQPRVSIYRSIASI